jgi:hypothetical protein
MQFHPQWAVTAHGKLLGLMFDQNFLNLIPFSKKFLSCVIIMGAKDSTFGILNTKITF